MAAWAWLTMGLILSIPLNAADPNPIDVRFLENHCYDCHGDGSKKGGLAIDTLSRDLSDADLQGWIDSRMSPQAATSTSPAKIREWVEAVFADKGTIAEVPLQMRSEPVPGQSKAVLIFSCRFVNGVADVRVTTAVTFEKGVNFLIENIEIDEHSLVSGP